MEIPLNKLTELRNQIDSVDKSLIELIAKRLKLVEQVGIYKKENGLPPLDPKRWQEVLNSKIELGKTLNIPQHLTEEIYNLIHETALEIEENTEGLFNKGI